MSSNTYKPQQVDRINSIIKRYLERKKENNNAYSNRAFARDMGLSPTFISNILTGKKTLPFKHLEKVITILNIDQAEAHELKECYSPVNLSSIEVNSSPNKKDWKLATRDQLKVLSKWYYLPMIDLVTCENFEGDFAGALNISPLEADSVLAELIDLGLLVNNERTECMEYFNKTCNTSSLTIEQAIDCVRGIDRTFK